ncbi:MAG: acetate--CoA ligase family protein [Dehalococcoidales bacterium]|jgi:acyl-CoA synthetase (NDP forming)
MDIKSSIIERVRKQGRDILTEIEAKQVFQEAGVKTVETRLASTQKEALAMCSQIGYPVVLKIASPDITHKSDAGGVKVGLKNEAEVKQAYRDIMASVKEKYPAAKIEGVSVQNMARPGIEIIVGMYKDKQFGPVIMFGLGGIFVEVLKDVSFRLIPILPWDAVQMIKEIKGYALLNGYRGQEPADIPSLEGVLLKVSALVEKTPEIKEIDLNPVFAYKDSAVAVDARIVVEK